MVIKKANYSPKRDKPVSFRLTEDSYSKLLAMEKVLGKSKSAIVEESLREAYEAAKRAYNADFAKAEKNLK